MTIRDDIKAFNDKREGRNAIYVNTNYSSKVTRDCFHLILKRGSLFTSTKEQLDKFRKDREAHGLDYALGMVLGYPPKCVEWFSRTSRQEHLQTGGLHGGSFSFKCPDSLMDYAKDYMRTHHSVTMVSFPAPYTEDGIRKKDTTH